MKINQKVISLICVALILFLILGKMQVINYSLDDGYQLVSYDVQENRLDSIANELREPQGKIDSINRVKLFHIDGYDDFSGFSGPTIGLLTSTNEDNVKKNERSYLVLCDLGLQINETRGPKYLTYYTANGKGYISRTKLIKKGNSYSVSYVSKPVNYRYNSERKAIMFPVDSVFWKYTINFAMIILTVFIIATSLFVLASFIKFLILISKNRAFEEESILRLKYMAIANLILSSYNYVFSFIIYLLFSINHSTEGIVLTHSFWDFDYFALILSMMCYLFYSAFKRGMLLQQEQDLTI